jgi:hypothetical protein
MYRVRLHEAGQTANTRERITALRARIAIFPKKIDKLPTGILKGV